MIVDPSRWKPFGKGQIAPPGSIMDNVLAARLAAYKRNVTSSYRSVSPDEIHGLIQPGRHLMSTKIDGECWFLYARDRQVHLLSPSRRAIAGVQLLDEAAAILEGQTILVAGELYASSGSHRPRVYDLMAALNETASAPDTLRFAAFDLLQDGDKDSQTWPFYKRAARLTELFGNSGSIHVVDFETADSPQAVADAFNRIVTHGGAEGIVLRLESGEVLKIKPEITIDTAVVGYAESQSRVHELLLALVRPDGRFLLIGRVSVGMSEAERKELYNRLSASLCPSSFRKATDQGTLYHLVRPEVVVEIKCNDVITGDSRDRPIRKMLLDYSGDGYAHVGPINSVSMINAVFLRVRDDKSANAAETGMNQVTDHVHLENARPPKLDVPRLSGARSMPRKRLPGRPSVRSSPGRQTNTRLTIHIRLLLPSSPITRLAVRSRSRRLCAWLQHQKR